MSDQHYILLGLKKGCSVYQARKAYHQLVKKYHPDNNPGNFEAVKRFREINAAYTEIKKDFQHYYEVLGLDKTATKADIEKAFYRLTHKDVGKGRDGKADEEMVKKYREIEEAYAVLRLGEEIDDNFGGEW